MRRRKGLKSTVLLAPSFILGVSCWAVFAEAGSMAGPAELLLLLFFWWCWFMALDILVGEK